MSKQELETNRVQGDLLIVDKNLQWVKDYGSNNSKRLSNITTTQYLTVVTKEQDPIVTLSRSKEFSVASRTSRWGVVPSFYEEYTLRQQIEVY